MISWLNFFGKKYTQFFYWKMVNEYSYTQLDYAAAAIILASLLRSVLLKTFNLIQRKIASNIIHSVKMQKAITSSTKNRAINKKNIIIFSILIAEGVTLLQSESIWSLSLCLCVSWKWGSVSYDWFRTKIFGWFELTRYSFG